MGLLYDYQACLTDAAFIDTFSNNKSFLPLHNQPFLQKLHFTAILNIQDIDVTQRKAEQAIKLCFVIICSEPGDISPGPLPQITK